MGLGTNPRPWTLDFGFGTYLGQFDSVNIHRQLERPVAARDLGEKKVGPVIGHGQPWNRFEPRVAVLRSAVGRDIVQIAPFFDYGYAWNRQVATPDPKTLASLGLGLIWNILGGSRFEVYWGQSLYPVPTQGGNLQDYGVHMQLIVEVL